MSTSGRRTIPRSPSAYRPGHADYTYDAKYGLRDWRGGGRSSARETAARVAAGAVARLVIPEVRITGLSSSRSAATRSTGPRSTTAQIDANPVLLPRSPRRRRAGRRWSTTRARTARSLGAIVECVATGVPAGWGAPVYAKLDAELAAAMMSINAVKGVEIGEGFGAARLRGEDNADAMRPRRGRPAPSSSPTMPAAIAGGISTGQPVVVRVAFKPTSVDA